MKKVNIEVNAEDAYAIELILKELEYARKKHKCEFNLFTVEKQACILSEEAGEVSKAVNDRHIEGFKVEAAQTAAVCIRILTGV